jgi:hypothetical protein
MATAVATDESLPPLKEFNMSESLIALPNDMAGTVRNHDSWPGSQFNDLAQLCVETAGRIAELNSMAIHASIDEQQAVALEAANEYSPIWRMAFADKFCAGGHRKNRCVLAAYECDRTGCVRRCRCRRREPCQQHLHGAEPFTR